MSILKILCLQFCNEKDGVLVEIHTKEKQEEVKKFLDNEKKKGKHIWMGLKKFECWVWTSDTPMCYTNWIEENPNDDGGYKKVII